MATFEANILFHIYWDGPLLYQSFVMIRSAGNECCIDGVLLRITHYTTGIEQVLL